MVTAPIERGNAVPTDQVNRLAGRIVLGLSLASLATVLVGVFLHVTQPPQPPPTDEGALAHLFQLAIVLLAPAGLVFLATADWTKPARIARTLVLPAISVVLAFGLLFYFEHYRNGL